jgi:type II secretory pathway pseudopilin PulG
MSVDFPTRSRRSPAAKPDPEAGFVLLAVLILLALLILGLSMAIPKVTTEIQRDKELELFHRGSDYARSIRHYYKKFGRYPATMDQLENTNEIRFLRKRYKDPITGKDDWRLIHFGEALVPPTGLFGQPLQDVGTPGRQSIYAHPPKDENSDSDTNGTTGTNPSGDSTNSGNSTNSSNSTNPGPANPNGTTGNQPGADLGGGPIVGVASSSEKASIRLFRQQAHYNQWEFIYDPVEDVGTNTGAGLAQQPFPIQGNGGAPGSPLAPSSTSPQPSPTPTPDTPQP